MYLVCLPCWGQLWWILMCAIPMKRARCLLKRACWSPPYSLPWLFWLQDILCVPGIAAMFRTASYSQTRTMQNILPIRILEVNLGRMGRWHRFAWNLIVKICTMIATLATKLSEQFLSIPSSQFPNKMLELELLSSFAASFANARWLYPVNESLRALQLKFCGPCFFRLKHCFLSNSRRKWTFWMKV